MNSTGWDFLKEGFLDVKAPPDSPERLLHKAWRRLWVSFIIFRPAGRGEPHLIAYLSRKKEDEHVKQVKASRDGLRLFRCKSTSRPQRTWGLSSGSSLLVYLAAETEEYTQQWMQAIRDGLWPPVSPSKTLTEDNPEVSLIDDEKSFTSGLLGVYGRLVKTSDDVVSVVHPHWQGVQMRWKLVDILDVCLVRKNGKEDISSGVLLLVIRSTNKQTRSLQFYSNTVMATIDWMRSLLGKSENILKCTKNIDSNEIQNSEVVPDQVYKTHGNTVDYADSVTMATNDQPQDESEQRNNDTSSNVYGKVSHSQATLANIPEAFLDASINSQMFQRRETDSSSSSAENEASSSQQHSSEDSDESLVELYDHIYEDLDGRKNSRSYTVYEEVDDGVEDEYVPPLPQTLPPLLTYQPPVQKLETKQDRNVNSMERPSTLRLQKLCESVSEALKLADEVVPCVKGPRPSLFQKIVGKSKSHHASPTLEHAPVNIRSNESDTIKRAVSESDITKTKLCSRDLPLLPFNCMNIENNDGYHSEGDNRNHLPLVYPLESLKIAQESDVSKKSVKNKRTLELINHSRTDKETKISSSIPPVQAETEYLDMSERLGSYNSMKVVTTTVEGRKVL